MSNLKFNFIQHEALIEHLEANMFPRKDYDPKVSDRDIMFSEGINHVIKTLKAKLKEQQEEKHDVLR